MKLALLVDSVEFWSRLEGDLASSRESVFCQALSFEGDGAGKALAGRLLSKSAADRRIVVDSFSRHVINDKVVWHPKNLLDRGLRAEARETDRLVDDLRRRGVGLRYVNPIGPFFVNLPARNHKKLVVVDGAVAYLGGINFSDHNFDWHDIMLRIEHAPAAAFLRDDFLATWSGRNRAVSARFPGLEIHVLDGRSNERSFAGIFSLIDGARESVFVECPYLTPPFWGPLREASRRGVRVTVVAPRDNNWKLVQRSMAWQHATSEIEVRQLPGMIHMKAMLVDGNALVMGSANFDVWSYRSQQEFVCVVTDPGVIADFKARVVDEDLRRSAPATPGTSWARGAISHLRLLALDAGAALWSRARVGVGATPPSLVQAVEPEPPAGS